MTTLVIDPYDPSVDTPPASMGNVWDRGVLILADRDAFLLLVDYDVSDKLGLVVRYSSYDSATGTSADNDVDTITIAPNYAITESLGAILEYSSTDNDTAGQDQDTIALELTYTF